MNDGGPAFPKADSIFPNGHESYESHDEGMSLRDYFAAKAMQGLVHDILIDQHWEDVLLKKGLTVDDFPDFLGHLSYLTADAMIAQRDKR